MNKIDWYISPIYGMIHYQKYVGKYYISLEVFQDEKDFFISIFNKGIRNPKKNNTIYTVSTKHKNIIEAIKSAEELYEKHKDVVIKE